MALRKLAFLINPEIYQHQNFQSQGTVEMTTFLMDANLLTHTSFIRLHSNSKEDYPEKGIFVRSNSGSVREWGKPQSTGPYAIP